MYCNDCHKDLRDASKMKSCRCKKSNGEPKMFKKKGAEAKVDMNPIALLDAPIETSKVTRELTDDVYPNGEKPKFDKTGTFYWCDPRGFSAVKMSRAEAANHQFRNHVVVLILQSRYDPSCSLRCLVLPLRASHYHPSELKKVVVLGDEDFIKREWEDICYFPDIEMVPGSPYSRADLRAVNVNTSAMVVILSPSSHNKGQEHQALADKEAILVTQNLKAMAFEEANGDMPEVKVNSVDGGKDNNSNIGSAIVPPSMPVAVPGFILEVKKQGTTRGHNIPMITELVCDSNAMYLDQDDMNIYDDDGIYLTQPYACGSAFTVSVLDSLVSATYFNSDILTLVRNMVTGAVNPNLDLQMAEGMTVTGTYETADIALERNRCRVAQISLYDGPLAEFGECGLFGDLFLYALRTYSMLCLGLYRFRDNNTRPSSRTGIPSTKRYVITFPEFNTVLAPTDLVFVLMQFGQSHKQKKKRALIVNSKASTATALTRRSNQSMFFND